MNELKQTDYMFIKNFSKYNFNATEAYHKLHPKLTRNQAATRAKYLANKPAVRIELDKVIKSASELAQLTADDVMLHLKEQLNADITDAFDDKWQLKAKEDIPPAVRRSISSIAVDPKTGKITLRQTDKKGIAELAGKTQAMYTDKHDINDKSSLADFVEELEKRNLDRPRISDIQN